MGGVLAAVLALVSLTACRTNVGYAATIDGTRYSESDISDYLTPAAQPVSGANGSGQVPTRAFVVETLIYNKLFERVLGKLPGGAPSESTLKQVRDQALAGSSVADVLRQAGIRGYTGDFTTLWLRTQIYSQVLQLAQQRGVDLRSVVTDLKFPVSVNPRYGTWDSKNLAFDGSAGAGAPPFLTLTGTSGGTTGADPATDPGATP